MSVSISTELLVRPYDPNEEAAVLHVMRLALGDSSSHTPKIPEFWQWKHFRNPFGKSYGICACDGENGQIAGVRSLMRWEFAAPNGDRVKAARAVDASTHPQYRRRGIFASLTKRAVEDLEAAGYAFIYNTPKVGGQSLPGYLKMGWQIVDHWPLYIRLTRPGSVLARMLSRKSKEQRIPAWDAVFADNVVPWEPFSSAYRDQIEAVLQESERERRQVGYRTPRTAALFDWRYGGHPTVVYGVLPYLENGRLTAFAVMRPNIRNGMTEVVLAELVAPNKRTGLKLLWRLPRSTGGDYIVCHFRKETLEHRLLGQAGFVRYPGQGITFTVKQLGQGPLDACSNSAWDLSLGDLEIF